MILHNLNYLQISSDVLRLFHEGNIQERSNFDFVFTIIWKDIPKVSLMVKANIYFSSTLIFSERLLSFKMIYSL